MRPQLYNGLNMLHIYKHVCMVFLFIIMFFMAIPTDVWACDVTDIDVWVGIDEDDADDADKTSIWVFAKTSFGVFVEWEAEGGMNDGNFYVQVLNRTSTLLDSVVHADDQWPWEETFEIDPGWEDGDSKEVYAKVKRVDFDYHDSKDLNMGFDCFVAVIGIDQSDDLWWFNGEDPDNYEIQVTLSAPELSTGTFVWTVTSGTGKVDLNNGGADSDTVTSTDENYVTLKSTDASGSMEDVTIQLEHDGVVKDTIDTEVYAPDSMTHDSDSDYYWSDGYICKIYYTIKDQFGDVLPSNIGVNEYWTGSVVSDYAGENWGRGAEEGGMHDPTAAFDTIYVRYQTTPTCQNPQYPLGTTKINHWPGDLYIGSTTAGCGVDVKSVTWQLYRDHARHE